ncbi:sodium-coupled monocarboxylate transporter 2-like [Copidosoma floridanum]|uniref:sodium-coupled monocarboxylate transporter 2-like n=1 Tax=Copidosoma floridanum TaxID=29053 RepID=UPI0006C9D4D2|nr:sodium-coupled monocarboxylate transporter 2-like [Copidosoma floridanum]
MLKHHEDFGWIDYTIFSSLLGVSLLIGVYFGFFSKQNSKSEYLFGGKSMNYFPVAMSILASFLSGITLLGVPTEVYLLGSQYYATIISAVVIGLLSTYVTLPVLFDLQVSSCYEYLELRFSRKARILASILYIIALLMYIPFVLYVPALAFSEVTGFNVHELTPIFSTVCIIYTSLGGVKAVVWTDMVQFVFTVAGFVVVIFLGLYSIGGVFQVWRIAEQGERIKFFNMNPSLLRRDTFWAISIGLTTSMLSRLGLGQKFVQRFLALKEKSDMKKAIFLVSFGWGIIQLGCVFLGLLMYAEYHDCDPLKSQLISRNDQILPHYVMDIAGHLPGVPGIFLAGLVSSGLSTMSASLNTLSATIYDTCVDRWIPETPQKDKRAANIMKFLSVFVGVVTIGLIFLVERLGTIYEAAFSLSSATEGALLGLLLLGLVFPWVGKVGAFIGACTSLVLMLWYVATTQWLVLNKKMPVHPTLPTSVENCSARFHESIVFIAGPQKPITGEASIIYQVSAFYFTMFGSLITIIVACATSYLVGETKMRDVNPRHISPFFRSMNPSLLRRDTFWAISIGLTTSMLSRLGLGQKFVQRFLALKEKSDMKKFIPQRKVYTAVALDEIDAHNTTMSEKPKKMR